MAMVEKVGLCFSVVVNSNGRKDLTLLLGGGKLQGWKRLDFASQWWLTSMVEKAGVYFSVKQTPMVVKVGVNFSVSKLQW